MSRKKRDIQDDEPLEIVPTTASRIGGRAMAIVATEEVQTRLDHLYLYAEDLGLAKSALDGMSKIIEKYNLEGPGHTDQETGEVFGVTTKEFLSATDSVMKFYNMVNSIIRKRTVSRAENSVDVDDKLARLQDVQNRILTLRAKATA